MYNAQLTRHENKFVLQNATTICGLRFVVSVPEVVSFVIQNEVKFKLLDEGDFMRRNAVIYSSQFVMTLLNIVNQKQVLSACLLL
jgi:hypothetical protein